MSVVFGRAYSRLNSRATTYMTDKTLPILQCLNREDISVNELDILIICYMSLCIREQTQT